jgi:hypothetical protein
MVDFNGSPKPRLPLTNVEQSRTAAACGLAPSELLYKCSCIDGTPDRHPTVPLAELVKELGHFFLTRERALPRSF